ncbi:MAG: NAD(P)H-dependent oxidoreductase [Collinsella sp.]|nr:NAD(P)H-dependent oxidoreductase [Collinsella sp.]
MNIVVLSGSPRKGANTDTMVETFAETAREGGHAVEVVRVARKKDRWLSGMPVLLYP